MARARPRSSQSSSPWSCRATGMSTRTKSPRPGGPPTSDAHAYEAAGVAAETRAYLIASGRSFIAETVFSHPSKLKELRSAQEAGYQVVLHVMLVPEELAVRRVAYRVQAGGTTYPSTRSVSATAGCGNSLRKLSRLRIGPLCTTTRGLLGQSKSRSSSGACHSGLPPGRSGRLSQWSPAGANSAARPPGYRERAAPVVSLAA